jgi:hypothetical protein
MKRADFPYPNNGEQFLVETQSAGFRIGESVTLVATEELEALIAVATEEKWHHKRTCAKCGARWGGLHCVHDGYQNPCPSCGETPKPKYDEGCFCVFDD